MPKGICVTARILDDRTYDAIASGEMRWWERIADDFWHDKLDGQNDLQLYDSLLLVAAEDAGCDEFLSEDLNEGQLYCGIRAVNPFK